MAIPYRLIDNPDGSVDILLFPGGGEELARELFPFRALRSPEARRVLYVRAVKVVLAGGLAVSSIWGIWLWSKCLRNQRGNLQTIPFLTCLWPAGCILILGG